MPNTLNEVAGPGSGRPLSPMVVRHRPRSQWVEREDVFWIGTNSDVRTSWVQYDESHGSWSQPSNIAIPGSVRNASPLLLLNRYQDQQEVFWIGSPDDVSSNWQNDNIDGGNWHQQFGIAGAGSVRADSPLVVTSRYPSHEDVFWIGSNGDVSSTWRDDNLDQGKWHQQFGIAFPGSVRPSSPLVVRNRYPQQQDVFWIGANADVSSNWQNDTIDNGRWHQQFGIAFPGSVRDDSPLMVLNRYPEQQDVFWIGANGDVSSNWQKNNIDDGRWHQQFGIASPGSVWPRSPLVVVNRRPEQQEVFWISLEGEVGGLSGVRGNWQNDTIDGGRWHQEFSIAPGGGAAPRDNSPLLALYPDLDNLWVFWIGADGYVWTNRLQGSPRDQASWTGTTKLPAFSDFSLGEVPVRPGSPFVGTAGNSLYSGYGMELFWIGIDDTIYTATYVKSGIGFWQGGGGELKARFDTPIVVTSTGAVWPDAFFIEAHSGLMNFILP